MSVAKGAKKTTKHNGSLPTSAKLPQELHQKKTGVINNQRSRDTTQQSFGCGTVIELIPSWAHAQMRRQERRLPSEKELRQKAHELALFKRFCSIKPFEIVEGTLTQPPPPAPDIRVEILGNGFIGFELVCVDEPAYLRGLNLMPESARLLTDFYERRLSAGERSAFDERYRNAMLHVHFADTAGQRGVRRTLRPLFDALMRLPAGLQGPSLEDQLTRVDGVQYVYISRDESFSGPEFTTPTSGMLTGLNIGALEAKLDKTYESDRPVELLAYAMEVSRQADDDAIKALVDERMPGRRIGECGPTSTCLARRRVIAGRP